MEKTYIIEDLDVGGEAYSKVYVEHLQKCVRDIANILDPECPDAGAYVDGHCSIVDLVNSKEAEIAQLVTSQKPTDTLSTCIVCKKNLSNYSSGYFIVHWHFNDDTKQLESYCDDCFKTTKEIQKPDDGLALHREPQTAPYPCQAGTSGRE